MRLKKGAISLQITHINFSFCNQDSRKIVQTGESSNGGAAEIENKGNCGIKIPTLYRGLSGSGG